MKRLKPIKCAILLCDDEWRTNADIRNWATQLNNAFQRRLNTSLVEKVGRPASVSVSLEGCSSLEEFANVVRGWNACDKGTVILCVLDFQFEGGKLIVTQRIDDLEVERWLDARLPGAVRLLLSHLEPSALEAAITEWDCEYVPKATIALQDNGVSDLASRLVDDYFTPSFWPALRHDFEEKATTSWHTPGHNRGTAFRESPLLAEFAGTMEGALHADLSVSVEYLGDLSEPITEARRQGKTSTPLVESQRFVARVFGAEASFFVTNGSSSANRALLGALLKPGDVVLVDRNCHKSVHQAVAMAGAYPLYLPTRVNDSLGVWVPSALDVFERFLKARYPDGLKPRALVLTSCSYEGVLLPSRRIAELCDEAGILFIADEAWASHSRFHPAFVHPPTDNDRRLWRYGALAAGAHFVTHSVHKTLAALSQASLLHVGKAMYALLTEHDGRLAREEWRWLRERLASDGPVPAWDRLLDEIVEGFRFTHSTSPLYPMMASIELSALEMQLHGNQALDCRLAAAERLLFSHTKLRTARVTKRQLLGDGHDFTDYALDPFKLLLRCENSEGVKAIETALMAKWIRPEKTSAGCVELLLTLGTEEAHISQLSSVLIQNQEHLADGGTLSTYTAGSAFAALVAMIPGVARSLPADYVSLDQATGRVAAHMVVPYPPGIPVLLPGQVISEPAIALVCSALEEGGSDAVHGLLRYEKQSLVRVVRETPAAEAAKQQAKVIGTQLDNALATVRQ